MDESAKPSETEDAGRADVLIIGAGASGGVVGRRLAEAGFSVVCLEQGRWHDRADYPARRSEWELVSRQQWAPDPNVRGRAEDYPVNDSESDITPLMFNAVGGGMILYAGDWPRMPPSDFRVRTLDGVADDWPITYQDLAPYYERIERQIGVSGLGGDPAYPPGPDPPLPPLPLGEGALQVARAHNSLGWHWWPGPDAIISRPYEGRSPCAQWGTCMQGCPEGAKASTDLTHWPIAMKHGARVITGARVRRLVLGPRNLVTGAEWVDQEGREHWQAADVVVLAANAIGTARLLLLSSTERFPDGLANSSGLVGRRLMMHPFAVVTGIFEESFETWKGNVGCRIHSLQFYESDERRGFVRGSKWSMAPSTGGPLNAALPARAGDVAWGIEHHRRVRERFGHCLSWGIFGEDLPDEDNRVDLDPKLTDSSGIPAPRVTYRISENSKALLDFQVARAGESLLEARATRIESVAGMRGAGWHLLGTARMGTDPDRSVVDAWGRSHDIPNLFIVDGSVFVTAGAVNPTNTITSLALRFADGMIDRRSELPVP
jgi:choline dehydrogenase-like flavoprotein